MIALIEPIAAKGAGPTYQLKVVLRGTKPPIWRRLQVPGCASLGWLHAVIQLAMGWTNSHLHLFQIGKQVYSDPRFELEDPGGAPPALNENKIALTSVLPRERTSLDYEYDFGDSWHHQVKVEKIMSQDVAPDARAVCLGGARACPPEDCGGAWRYAELLRIVRNPKHEEYADMKGWLGGSFDSEKFDQDGINRILRKLKWPKVTESHLRRLLMERDDYSE